MFTTQFKTVLGGAIVLIAVFMLVLNQVLLAHKVQLIQQEVETVTQPTPVVMQTTPTASPTASLKFTPVITRGVVPVVTKAK